MPAKNKIQALQVSHRLPRSACYVASSTAATAVEQPEMAGDLSRNAAPRTVRIFGVSIWVRPICRAAAQCQAGLTACPSFSTPVVVSIHPPTRALRSLRGRRRQLLQSYHRLSSTISRWSRRVAIYLLPVARTRKNCLLPTTGSNAHRVRWVAGHRRLVVVGLCIILHLCARAAQVGL